MMIIQPTTAPNQSSEWRDWNRKTAEAASRIAPFAAERDANGTFVHEAFELLRAEGFLSASVPVEVGGGGATYAETGRILTELGRACPATAVTLAMHYYLVAVQVWQYKNGRPAGTVLRRVADNALLISTGPANWTKPSGEAERVDGGFKISARKPTAGGAPVGTLLVTGFSWVCPSDGPTVIHCAIPMAAEGVSIEQTWDTMGLRSAGANTVVLDDVFVPDAAVSLSHPAGEWHPVWATELGCALPLSMAAYLGITEAAVDLAIASATWQTPDPGVEMQVGGMMNHLTIVRDTVDAMLASSHHLTFEPTFEHASAVLARKTVAAEAAVAAARSALEICGGEGYTKGGGVERLFRDVHGALYLPLPAAQQMSFAGRHALGLDPIA